MSPLVSIVIPAFRPGPVFRDTLRSCVEQDFDDLEVVVALDGDDASVRRTIEEVDDPRVRLIEDGRRYGQFANFNRAVDASTGAYVKLFSADDVMSRDCVRVMVGWLERHPDIGVCASRHVAFQSDAEGRIANLLDVPVRADRELTALDPVQGRHYLALYGNQLGGPSNVMIRRSAWWASGGFDPRIGHLGDLAYWNRAVARSGLLLVDRPLVAYRIHENSVTGRDALRFVRVDEPFAIADDATLGAWFPARRYWRRHLLNLTAVNSTTGFAMSMLRRRPAEGLRAVGRVLLCGGPLLLPATLLVAGWAVLRSSLLGLGPMWPFPTPWTSRQVEAGCLDTRALVELLSDPQAVQRLQAQAVR